MKKLLTESTFKRLIKTFINEDISKIKSDAILAWIRKFNEKAGTSYHQDDLANIADYVLKVLKPQGRNKINGKTIEINKINTDEELRAVMKLIDDDKARKASSSIGGFSDANKNLAGINFNKLTDKEKFKLIKQYHTTPHKLFPDKKYKPISDDQNRGFPQIEQAFGTNDERSPRIPYAVWYSLLVFNGIKEAEDAPLINEFINIFNVNKEAFPMHPLKIRTKYDFDRFYDIASEIQNKNSGINDSSSASHVSQLIKKYGKSSKYPLYQGDFNDEKYSNTYAFFLVPVLQENEIEEYSPILRELGMGSTWCFAYGWSDGKQDNKSFIKTYCTQDTTRILINKADPFNKVNGKFAMNKINSSFMNINDQPVLG